MSIARLQTELSEITKRLQATLYAYRPANPNPAKSGPLPPMSFPDFAAHQQNCLKELDECCLKILAMDAFVGNVCLFLGGSAARLEHLPQISDFDFLPLRMNFPENVFTSPNMESWEFADKHHREFMKFKETLIDAVIGRFPGINKRTVDVGARALLLHFQGFLTEIDVFEKLGYIEEASRASWARSVLLFEGVAWGETDCITRLRTRSDDFYGASTDLMKGSFPGMAYSFICYFTYSCLLTELGLLRDRPAPDDAGKRRADAELIKAVFSRLWYSVINRLLLHALFWHAIISVPQDKEKIAEKLRATPIGKLVLHLPQIMKDVHGRSHEIWGKVAQSAQEGVKPTFSEFKERLERIRKALEPPGTGKTLADRFLQVLQLCQEVNSGKDLDGTTREELRQINLEMRKILENCMWISDLLGRSLDAQKADYDWLTARIIFEMV